MCVLVKFDVIHISSFSDLTSVPRTVKVSDMSKTILITGSTDGIGLEAAKMLAKKGQRVLLHGRNPRKLEEAKSIVSALAINGDVEGHIADLSNMDEVKNLAQSIFANHDSIDVLINNAGVYKTPSSLTSNGQDIRFVVNTVAPYLLTKRLLPLLGQSGRIINLSSAAQASVNLDAFLGKSYVLDDMSAYAQSKLAITMWSRHLARTLGAGAPVIIPVNPGSLLASKMVKDGFGVEGNDLSIGAEILTRLSLDEEFSDKTGQYFDNDKGSFGQPHIDALNNRKCTQLVETIEALLN